MTGRLVDYVGGGVIADRPVSLTLTTGAIGFWYATDTGAITVWDGSAWQTPTISVPDETIDDRVAALLVAGTGITLTYNDVANTLTIDGTVTQYTDEMARDALGTALTAGTGITITPNDVADTITVDVDTTTEAERIRDVIGTALVAGTNVTITVNDVADTITIAAAGGSGQPWWWNPPVAADFTAVSGDATLPTKSDDADVGMIISNGASVAGPIRRIVHKALPAGVDWTATARIVFDAPTMNFIGGGLFAYESGSGKILDIVTIPSNDATNRSFLDTHGGTTCTLTAAGTDLVVTREAERTVWFRIVHDHAADTYQTLYSYSGKSWVQHLAATTAAALGISHYDKIGLGFYNLGTGASAAYVTCDHFVIS